jgi:hypothetical protein
MLLSGLLVFRLGQIWWTHSGGARACRAVGLAKAGSRTIETGMQRAERLQLRNVKR